jgi:hypothetical protein
MPMMIFKKSNKKAKMINSDSPSMEENCSLDEILSDSNDSKSSQIA